MRTGPHNNNYKNNNNRNRNRNRRPGGGGGNPGGGGSGGNRVLDSNGPDVKLRGTAQTIAEKYMQLGRDAQSSGDPVMSESYFQHADHYYRVWLALQPAGQPIQFSRRLTEEEMEDEAGDGGEDDGPAEGIVTATASAAPPLSSEQNLDGSDASGGGDGQNQNRNFRPRDQQQGNRDKFRPRWPRRSGGDRPYENRDGNVNGQAPEGTAESQDRSFERVERANEGTSGDAGAETGNWEAPSFLKRPAPVAGEQDTPEAEGERRPRGRKPRGEDPAPAVEGVVPAGGSED